MEGLYNKFFKAYSLYNNFQSDPNRVRKELLFFISRTGVFYYFKKKSLVTVTEIEAVYMHALNGLCLFTIGEFDYQLVLEMYILGSTRVHRY